MTELQNNDDMKKELRDYVKETFFHELDRVNNRTDWFLIFHAILLEAFFACNSFVATDKRDDKYFPLIAIGLIGILTSYIWLMNGIRAWINIDQIGVYMENNKIMGDGVKDKQLNTESPQNIADMHKKIFLERNTKYLNWTLSKWAKDVPSFAIIFPLLFLIAWEVIVGHYICGWLILLSIIPMVIISLIIWWLGPGPTLRNQKENK